MHRWRPHNCERGARPWDGTAAARPHDTTVGALLDKGRPPVSRSATLSNTSATPAAEATVLLALGAG